ncbi:CoA-transferase [Phytoactinopolyspora limicola]|uniref:CoA-transferase n=1 Tax=Phytoactinopolyspora limicola TaxID=2715536 RepID=UPI00140E1A61|nr:CoA-transferase [Phytoactinopolyspora limicola]
MTTPAPGIRLARNVDELCADHLTSGLHLHVASTMSRPNALVLAVARSFARRGTFEVSVNAMHASMHALVMAGVISRAVTCFAGDTVPSARPNPLYARLPEGVPFPVEEWSLLSLLQRLVAGATQTPGAVTGSLVGSSLPTGRAAPLPVVSTDTSGARPAVLVPPLTPDVTLLHAHYADQLGNLYLSGPAGEGWWGALAARQGVLATVEAVCDQAPPGAVTVVPAERVLGVAVCPFGAHPQGLSPMPGTDVVGYLDDYAFLTDLAAACVHPATCREWFRQWVSGSGGHDGYLDRLGPTRLAALTVDVPAATLASPPAAVRARGPTKVASGAASDREWHVVMAARAIARAVESRGYRTVLAGLGVSHLACWLAAHQLETSGVHVDLVNELGMIDFTPEPGDTFLFSQRHVARARLLAGTLDVLGGLVAGDRGRTLGVLSAAQIDVLGNVNTSRTSSGAFLVGSGGANDVASHVDTMIVAPASPARYVPAVDFITSPGRTVRWVVADFGEFERDGGTEPFTLTTWFPAPRVAGLAPVDAVAQLTAWGSGVARRLRHEPPLTTPELALLRSIDPEGVYR